MIRILTVLLLLMLTPVAWALPATCTGTVYNGQCTKKTAAYDAASQIPTYQAQVCNPNPVFYKVIHIPVSQVQGTFSMRYKCISPPTSTSDSNQIGAFTYSENDCAGREPVYGGWVRSGSKFCVGSCQVTPGSSVIESDSISTQGLSSMFLRTRMDFTGEVCMGEGPLKPNDNYCEDLPGGHKFCVNKDGRRCLVSGMTGASYCNPGPGNPQVDTGRREAVGSDGNPPANRQGESWQPGGPTTNVTNTNNNGCQSNCTTTTNYTYYTNNGNPNNNPGSGVPGDGSTNNPDTGAGCTGSNCQQQDTSPTASGGGTCAAAPVCDKPGDVRCAVLLQTWLMRCDGYDPNAPHAADTYNQTLNEQEIALSLASGVPEGVLNGTYGPAAQDVKQIRDNNWLTSQLDHSRFLGGDCPGDRHAAVKGQDLVFSFSPICGIMSSMGLLVVGLAYFGAFKIVMGG